MLIDQIAAEFGRFLSFQNGGRPPSGIFSKFKILTADPVRTAYMRHHAKFSADQSNYCGDMAIFRFFKMADIPHVQFLKMLTADTVRTANMRHCANFFADRSNHCGDMAIF